MEKIDIESTQKEQLLNIWYANGGRKFDDIYIKYHKNRIFYLLGFLILFLLYYSGMYSVNTLIMLLGILYIFLRFIETKYYNLATGENKKEHIPRGSNNIFIMLLYTNIGSLRKKRFFEITQQKKYYYKPNIFTKLNNK